MKVGGKLWRWEGYIKQKWFHQKILKLTYAQIIVDPKNRIMGTITCWFLHFAKMTSLNQRLKDKKQQKSTKQYINCEGRCRKLRGNWPVGKSGINKRAAAMHTQHTLHSTSILREYDIWNTCYFAILLRENMTIQNFKGHNSPNLPRCIWAYLKARGGGAPMYLGFGLG